MPTVEISQETFDKLKEQLGVDPEPVDFDSIDSLIGKKWFFRTVTMYVLGKVVKRSGKFIQLEKASWVSDTRKFTNFIKDGIPADAEIEPTGVHFLNMDSVVDFFPWKHDLPTKAQ